MRLNDELDAWDVDMLTNRDGIYQEASRPHHMGKVLIYLFGQLN